MAVELRLGTDPLLVLGGFEVDAVSTEVFLRQRHRLIKTVCQASVEAVCLKTV